MEFSKHEEYFACISIIVKPEKGVYFIVCDAINKFYEFSWWDISHKAFSRNCHSEISL